MEEIPDITSDIIEKLKKLNIGSVYQLAVQNPAELAMEYEDTSLSAESASRLIANARKILIDNEVLSQEFLTADDLLEKRNKLSRYATGSESLDNLMNGGWSQNYPRNTNITINASMPSDSPLAALRDAFSNDPKTILTVNGFGNFTAYFVDLPPPVSPELTASLITAIVAALVGSLLIPAVSSWFKSKKQTSRLNLFHLQMDRANADGKVDENDINKLEA